MTKKKISTGKKKLKFLPDYPVYSPRTQPDFLTFLKNYEATIQPPLSPYRYVLVYAHSHLYEDAPRHALLVKKKPGSLHDGLLNLPGGKINPDEKPAAAALRELKEETGLDATMPQLIGAIINGPMDDDQEPFLVYIYRVIIAPQQELNQNPKQPCSWHPIKNATGTRFIPNLSVILPLIAAGTMGFVIEDCWWEESYKSTPGQNGYRKSQTFVTMLNHDVSKAAGSRKACITAG